MKNKIFLSILIIITINYYLQAQQLPLFSQYMLNNEFMINPAIAGSVDYMPITLSARQQWVGIKDAPKTVVLSAHSIVNKKGNMGIGGCLFSDQFGPVRRTGLMAAYSHHFNITSRNKLALGLSALGFQQFYDKNELLFSDQNEPVLNADNFSTVIPDVNFGAFYYNQGKYWIGISVSQLLQREINVGLQKEGNKMVRHYYLTGSYTFNLNKYIKHVDLEPSVVLRGSELFPIQADINMKGYYKKNYWLGITYRTKDALVVTIGTKYQNYYIGYSYDYTFGNIMNYSSGTHEIRLGINIGEGQNKGSSLL